MCRTLLRSVFAFSWAVTRAEKSGLGGKFGVVLVSLLISPLCLAATSSDIRIRSIECYNGTDWATRTLTQRCGSAFPGILGCDDALTACGLGNPQSIVALPIHRLVELSPKLNTKPLPAVLCAPALQGKHIAGYTLLTAPKLRLPIRECFQIRMPIP